MSKKELHQTGIVITRPSHQTAEIKSLVNEHQGHPIEFPLLEIQSKSQNETFQHTVLKLEDYDWAIFISSNAVQFGMPAVKNAFHTLPESIKFAAIGPSTQKALKLFDVQDVLIIVASVIIAVDEEIDVLAATGNSASNTLRKLLNICTIMVDRPEDEIDAISFSPAQHINKRLLLLSSLAMVVPR